MEISRWPPALRLASPQRRKLSGKTTSLWFQREPMGLKRGCLWCGTELWYVLNSCPIIEQSGYQVLVLSKWTIVRNRTKNVAFYMCMQWVAVSAVHQFSMNSSRFSDRNWTAASVTSVVLVPSWLATVTVYTHQWNYIFFHVISQKKHGYLRCGFCRIFFLI